VACLEEGSAEHHPRSPSLNLGFPLVLGWFWVLILGFGWLGGVESGRQTFHGFADVAPPLA
jgi:hypothetical protein